MQFNMIYSWSANYYLTKILAYFYAISKIFYISMKRDSPYKNVFLKKVDYENHEWAISDVFKIIVKDKQWLNTN